ncbi:MAG: hypothetical protein R8K46_05855 [Mariprofundaceae bacterium]
MKNKTLYLPGFYLPPLRRKPRSAQQILTEKIRQLKQKSFSQLGECFGKFIPNRYLRPTEFSALSRRRLFSKENTFWAFFSQVLDADGGCQEVVRKFQAFVAMKSKPLPSSSTAAYCQARQRIDLPSLESIHRHLSERLQGIPTTGRLNGRRVIVVDGTGVSMPDTEENQRE